MKEFPGLIHLELRGNKLENTNIGNNLASIQKLYLAKNEISSINLENFTNLQVLHLRDNKLEVLDGFGNGEQLVNLNYVNLRYYIILPRTK